MIPISLAAAATLLRAESSESLPVTAGRDSDKSVESLVVDSRRVTPGAAYVALPGERVDGHDFVAAAFAAGAVVAITARPIPDAGGPCLVVRDPLVALGRLARDQVDRGVAGGLQVAAMTGSQGKTSTKDLLAQVLERIAPTVAPHGNLNNEIGLPLTVARIDAETRFLVAEMGARGIGHVRYLCELAPPTVSAVLNVGHAHVGEFGSQEAIAIAKGEIVEALPTSGVAVLNADDALVWAMRSRTRAEVLGFSTTGDPGGDRAVWARGVASDPLGRCVFTLHVRDAGGATEHPVELRVAGGQQVANAVAAAGMAVGLGVRAPDVAAGLGAAEPRSRWRMEVRTRSDGLVVINDAYNANPDSMRAALDALAAVAGGRPGRSWAVLGDMLELGASAEDEHRALGAAAAERGVDRLVVLGEFAEVITDGARHAGLPAVEIVPDREAAADLVARHAGPGDVVLVKASRGLALETVAEALLGVGTDESVPPIPPTTNEAHP